MRLIINLDKEDYENATQGGFINRENLFKALKNAVIVPIDCRNLIDRDHLAENIHAAALELDEKYYEGLWEAWEIINDETATPVIIKKATN